MPVFAGDNVMESYFIPGIVLQVFCVIYDKNGGFIVFQHQRLICLQFRIGLYINHSLHVSG